MGDQWSDGALGAAGVDTYQAPNPGGNFSVAVDPDSHRLQLLEPFKKWDGKDIQVPPPPTPASSAAARIVGVCSSPRRSLVHSSLANIANMFSPHFGAVLPSSPPSGAPFPGGAGLLVVETRGRRCTPGKRGWTHS